MVSQEIKSALWEWADIQNIVIDKEFNKELLDKLKNNEIDVCSALSVDICEKQEGCIIHKSNCVNEERITSLHNPTKTILSKKHNIQFTVLDSKYLSTVYLTTVQFQLYYVSVLSHRTGNIYILFSSGIVLTEEELYGNIELNDRLRLLIGQVVLYCSQGYKVIFGGHSMGGVLAMYTSLLMREKSKFKKMFEDSCYVFGTASAKWLQSESDYSNLSNVYQFISGELRETKKSHKLLVDCYVNEGNPDLVAYTPYNYIYSDIDKTEVYVTENLDETIKLELTEKNSSQCKKLHRWDYYANLINMWLKTISTVVTTTPVVKSQLIRSKSVRRRGFTKKNRKSKKDTKTTGSI